MTFAAVLLSAVGISIAVVGDHDQADETRLMGVWLLTEESCRGYPSSEAIDGAYSFEFSKATVITSLLHKGVANTCKTDWSKNPATIDIIDNQDGSAARGIMKFSGDQLIIAWAVEDTPRPTSFDPYKNSIVMTLDRDPATTRPCTTNPATRAASQPDN